MRTASILLLLLFAAFKVEAQFLLDVNASSTRLAGHANDQGLMVKDAFNYGVGIGIGWQKNDRFRITLEQQFATRNRIIKNLPLNIYNPDGFAFLERAILKSHYYSANIFISNRLYDIKGGRLDMVFGHYFQYFQLGSDNSNSPPKGFILNGEGKDEFGNSFRFPGTEVIQNALALGLAYEKNLKLRGLRLRIGSNILFHYWPMSSKQNRFVQDKFNRPREEQYYHQTTGVFAAELKLGLIYCYLRK